MQSVPISSRPHVALHAASITKIFGSTVALWDVDLVCRSGDLLAIQGSNGSGKSTLLRVLAGLVAPTLGQVSVTAAPGARRRVGFVGHATHLFDQLTALENVALAARLARRDVGHASAFLDELGVASHAADRVATLSSGTRRRVAIARALATDPDVLILDEPFAGLDHDAADLVMASLVRERIAGRVVVVATHDDGRSRTMGTHLARLEAGRYRPEPGFLSRRSVG